MHTTIGYYSASVTGATLELIPAIADQHVRVAGNDIYIGAMNQIIGYQVIADVPVDAQLSSPSLRRVALEDIACLNAAAVGAACTPTAAVWKLESPRVLEEDEALNALVNATATNDVIVVVLLSDGPVVPITGEIITIEGSIACTPVAGAWTNGALTFAQTLPVGRYQIVGADVIDDAASFLRAFRLVPIGEVNRPGGFTRPTQGTTNIYTIPQRMGRMGVWTEFDHLTPPTFDLLGTVAGGAATFECFLDLIKVT